MTIRRKTPAVAATFLGALLGASALTPAAAIAQTRAEQTVRDFDIAPQPLQSALLEFSRQSQSPVVASTALVRGLTAPAIAGRMDEGQALAAMLDGTGLIAMRGSDGGWAISRKADQDPQGGSAAGGGATVEALIVTAQKREEDIQDVPIAISAFSQEDLTRSQVAGGPDLMTQVPNMTFTKTNFASYSIQIRGIGTQAISATVDPAVAVAFNNTPFVRNRFFEQEFYDLQRVEVLRGPQGTLYGRNATAGVVNIISAKPKFIFEAKAAADIASYNSSRIEGMINIPVVEDAVAFRLAGAWTKRDGYAFNEITGSPIDGRDLWSTRASLRFSPNDRFEANVIWEHFEEDDDRLRSGKQLCKKYTRFEIDGRPVPMPGFGGAQSTNSQSQLSQGCGANSLYDADSFQTPNGFAFPFYWPLTTIGLPVRPGAVDDPYVKNYQSRDLRVIESTVDPHYQARANVVEFQFNYDLNDTLTVSSETAWATDYLFSTQDYNRFNTKPGAWAQSNARPNVLNDGVFCDPQVGCSDRLVLVDLIHSEATQFSQELRLASNYDGPFNFSVGANFLRGDSEDKYYVFINSLTLWVSSAFIRGNGGNAPPYEPGVSDNLDCQRSGLEPISLSALGGVGTTLNCAYIDPNPIGSLNDLGHNYFLSKNPYKLISYAAFGEVYYELADNLKLTAGLRWTVDQKEAPRIPSWVITTKVGYPVLEVVEQEWREPTGRLAIDWKPDLSFTDDTLLYASYAHGYKAGGANPPPAGVALNVKTADNVPTPSDTHPLTFDAEYVDAFELGAKNTLFDGRVTFNATAFYYDYKGYQLSQIVDRSAITKNFDATVWGLEIEADWRPVENLRFGFKGGYEDTRVADGMSAVDVMDRSDGDRLDAVRDGNGDVILGEDGEPLYPFHWIVVKPFPIYPSNCVMPSYLWTRGGVGVGQVGNVNGSGNSGPCDVSYFQGLDIFTMQPYEPFPDGGPSWSNAGFGANYPNYPGYNPAWAPNNGEGFSKDLSGNALPNAPHFTATITADYTVPLAGDWLMNLHTDLYYQSEAWTRIFNTPGYDKLKAYTNINLAAIFINEPGGWNVMAYVKNVFDRDSITGAFLNSDDTGLTTNVFLTEPRIYGLRVTKTWTGGPLLGTFGERHDGPYPFTVEISGQIQRHDAPYDTLEPEFGTAFPAALDTNAEAQHRDLDWGDGRAVKLTWQPDGSLWSVAAGIRYGRANGGQARLHDTVLGEKKCGFTKYPQVLQCDPEINPGLFYQEKNWSDVTANNREEHTIADFTVGRDFGVGLTGTMHSSVAAGLRHARLESTTNATMDGIPDWFIPQGWAPLPGQPTVFAHHNRYIAALDATREFNGTGPTVSWDASIPLLGDEQMGHVDLEWSIGGGLLFGKQKTAVVGQEQTGYWEGTYQVGPRFPDLETTPVNISRSDSVTVPVADLSLGLSYEVDRLRVSTGYRWERYFDALDVGYQEAKDGDRTIDGPYFRLAVGFGG